MTKTIQKRASVTRQRILDAAEDCFCKVDIGNTTLSAIAKHGHFTRGAIYWHFDNKNELLNAVIHRKQMTLIEKMENAINAKNGTPIEALQQYLTQFIHEVVTDHHARNMLEIMIGHYDNDKDNAYLSQLKQHSQQYTLTLISECFEKIKPAQLSGRYHCPKTCAQLIHFSLIGVVQQCLTNPRNKNLPADAINALGLMFDLFRTEKTPQPIHCLS